MGQCWSGVGWLAQAWEGGLVRLGMGREGLAVWVIAWAKACDGGFILRE